MYEEYLDETFLPYVRKVMVKSTNAGKANSAGFDQFMACLGQCLERELLQVKVCHISYAIFNNIIVNCQN